MICRQNAASLSIIFVTCCFLPANGSDKDIANGFNNIFVNVGPNYTRMYRKLLL
jgi:hypothetical protein